MPKQSIFRQHSKRLNKKGEKSIEEKIFSCLLNVPNGKAMSAEKIAQEIGCSTSTIRRHIKTLIDDKKTRGDQLLYVRWSKNGYKMEREDINENRSLSDYYDEIIYDLAETNACTELVAKEITSTVIFWGITKSYIQNFEMNFRNCFSQDWYYTLIVQKDGLYIILNEVSKKDLVERRTKIVDFYEKIVKESERQRKEKSISCKQAHINIK